jgi:hypothetical protein
MTASPSFPWRWLNGVLTGNSTKWGYGKWRWISTKNWDLTNLEIAPAKNAWFYHEQVGMVCSWFQADEISWKNAVQWNRIGIRWWFDDPRHGWRENLQEPPYIWWRNPWFPPDAPLNQCIKTNKFWHYKLTNQTSTLGRLKNMMGIHQRLHIRTWSHHILIGPCIIYKRTHTHVYIYITYKCITHICPRIIIHTWSYDNQRLNLLFKCLLPIPNNVYWL